jgi:hypothetical protein
MSFDAVGGHTVLLDGATFVTEASKPIGAEQWENTDVIVDTADDADQSAGLLVTK